MPTNHIDIDIEADANPANPPKVVVRGQPAGFHPALRTALGDTVQWHNKLQAEDISIAIPWAKRVLKNGDATVPIVAGDESSVFTVKPSVSANYKNKPLRYLVLAEGSGVYAVANSDADIEIK